MYLHVIKDLGEISGAELAMLKIASRQHLGPLRILSLRNVTEALSDYDVEVVSLGGCGVFGNVRAGLELFLQLRQPEVKAVICWMYSANIIVSFVSLFCWNRFRLIWNVRHSLDSLETEGLATRISIFLNWFWSFSPDKIVFASLSSMAQHVAYGFPSGKSLHIPNGFDTRQVADSASPKKQRGPRVVLGSVGRLVEAKDIGNLLRAFQKLWDSGYEVELRLAGNDFQEDSKPLNELVDRVGVQNRGDIVFLGFQKDLTGFYRGLDIFVLSSRSEAFPNVLAEAMLNCVPCVTTDVGDASAIVGQWGIVVEPENSDKLAKGVAKLLSADQDALDEITEGGRAKVIGDYSLDTIAWRYDSLMEGSDG